MSGNGVAQEEVGCNSAYMCIHVQMQQDTICKLSYSLKTESQYTKHKEEANVRAPWHPREGRPWVSKPFWVEVKAPISLPTVPRQLPV